MTRRITLAAVTFTITFAAVHAASAQVVAYHHRSTVWGDHLAGASELVRAQGAYLRDEADAAETWVRTQTAYDALMYQRAEYRFQEKLMALEYQKEKTAAFRDRAAAEDMAEDQQARRLFQAAQHGGYAWPSALHRSEYASSLALIDSILRTWTPEISSGDVYRRALATEAAVLRARVTTNTTIAHQSRLEAVRALKLVQRLADTAGLESSGPVSGTQVAMR